MPRARVRKPEGESRSAKRWTIGLSVLVLLAIATGIGIASGWLPSLIVPRKIVVKGNAIIPAHELVAAAGQERTASYLSWWRAFNHLDQEQVRWLADARSGVGWGRSLVVEVTEQRPVLRTATPDGDYWLCDDYQLVPVSANADTQPVFENIARLPQVELEAPTQDYLKSQGEDVLITASCLQQVMPGVIKRIKLDRRGMLWCYTAEGFQVKLGEPEHLAEKIGALPKALRLGAEQRSKQEYLDASDPRIFYQRWQEPPEA